MKFYTFAFALFFCTALQAQVKPHLQQVPKNQEAPHQLEDIELNQQALPGIPLQAPSLKAYYDYAHINSLPTPHAVGTALKVIPTEHGTPRLIKGTLDYPKKTFEGKSALENECLSYLEAIQDILKVDDAVEYTFQLQSHQTGLDGQEHARFQQYAGEIPVYGAEFVLHLENGAVQMLTGRTVPQPRLENLSPGFTKNQAIQIVKDDLGSVTSVKDLTENQLPLVGGRQQEAELVIYYKEKDLTQEHLAWHIEYAPNIASRWTYFVDAHTGEILQQFNQICQLHKHTADAHEHMPPDGPAIATATDLFGVNRTINTYEKNGVFFLIDASRPMHNENQSNFPDEGVGVVWTIDAEDTSPQNDNFSTVHLTSGNNTWNNPTAVSAHYNAGEAYEYFRTTFGRNSINGQGGNIISLINVRDENNQDMDNAFWNGYAMFYGNGDQVFTDPLAKALDVASHELSHGVIQNTANLEYFGESGAMNESFADIFAVMVDRDDWQLGEDIVNTSIFSTGALRDVSNPNNGGTSLNTPGWQPASVSEQFFGSEDNGGVHINSGITNRVFFLFASEVGKDVAEQVYYEALANYLVRSSQFIDLRIAIIAAAEALYNTSVANAAASAFTQVGIGSGEGTNPQEDVGINPGQEFIFYTDGNFSNLNITTPAGEEVAEPLYTISPLSKPSITDDGSVVVFIDEDKRMQIIDIDWGTGNASIDFLSNSPIWRNVAISKDGNRIAALTDDFDNRLFIFDLTTNPASSAEYALNNPTYAEGVETGDVVYADVLEWDFSGEFVMYDALNSIENSTSTIEYWDVGFIQVWNEASNTFADGFISKLFSGLPEDSSVGNPTFSKNSPFIIALDFIDSFNEEYFIIGANIETGEVGTIRQNSVLGYPNYSIEDDQLIFDAENTFDERVIGVIDLASDKINPNGDASVLISNFNGARWGVWFANGDRDLTDVQTLSAAGVDFTLYPNPVREELMLELVLENATELQIRVVDLLGRKHLAQEKQLFSGQQNIPLDVSDLVPGTYFIQVNSNGILGAKTFIKLK
jgi:Zn-dependent metalloprotease